MNDALMEAWGLLNFFVMVAVIFAIIPSDDNTPEWKEGYLEEVERRAWEAEKDLPPKSTNPYGAEGIWD